MRGYWEEFLKAEENWILEVLPYSPQLIDKGDTFIS